VPVVVAFALSLCLAATASAAPAALTEAPTILVIGDSLDFWGWFFLIIGVLMVLTAILLFMRRAGGVILVGIGATTSALIAFFALLANTDQALIIIALDLLILWAVFAHVDDFE